MVQSMFFVIQRSWDECDKHYSHVTELNTPQEAQDLAVKLLTSDKPGIDVQISIIEGKEVDIDYSRVEAFNKAKEAEKIRKQAKEHLNIVE